PQLLAPLVEHQPVVLHPSPGPSQVTFPIVPSSSHSHTDFSFSLLSNSVSPSSHVLSPNPPSSPTSPRLISHSPSLSSHLPPLSQDPSSNPVISSPHP
ncbi:unnamed protein product, partial [Prunus brigantina]